jgi:phage/plasmid primase, P4 family, C-terminal domain
MKFEECYRGFIWADMEKFYNQEKKRPDKRIRTYTGKDRNGNVKEFVKMESYRQKKKLKTFAQAKNMPQNYNSIVGVLAPNIILIDVDTKEEGEKLIEILTDLGINCPMIESDKGYHFLFKDIYGYKKSDTKFYTPIGIEIDIKLGNKGGLEFLTVAGEERKIINDTAEIPDLPIFLYSRGKFEQIGEIKETDGYSQRNDFMNAHNYHLQKLGYTFDEALEICAIVDGYIFYEPLPESEFKRTVRDLGLELENGVYSDKIPLENVTAEMFFNEKGRFMHHLFGEYLIIAHNIVKIENKLHIYDNGIYTNDILAVKKAMSKMIPGLTIRQKREVMDHIETMVDTVEVNQWYKALKNGLWDIKNRKLIDFTPSVVCTNRIPTKYNPNADTKVIDRIIGSFVKYREFDKRLIYEMIGSIFYPNKNQIAKAFMIIGNMSNGKSVFFRLLENLLGKDNRSTLDLKALGNRFSTILLKGKIVNLGDDISGKFIIETDIFKKLVTGESMNVEEKGKQGIDTSFSITLIFTANKVPGIDDPTGAILRRLIFIKFDNDFSVGSPERDEKIFDKIMNENNLEALLYLSLNALGDLIDRGYIEEDEKMKKSLLEYDMENNTIKAFYHETMEDEENSNWYINKSTQEVYNKYTIYCGINGRKPKHKITFSREFTAFTGTAVKSKRDDKGKKYKYYDIGTDDTDWNT